jgi:hypothetical protein
MAGSLSKIMTTWVEPPEAEEVAPLKPRLWMNHRSTYEERYTQPNDGYIEIDNGPGDENDNAEKENTFEEVVKGMKARAKTSNAKKRAPPKSRKPSP